MVPGDEEEKEGYKIVAVANDRGGGNYFPLSWLSIKPLGTGPLTDVETNLLQIEENHHGPRELLEQRQAEDGAKQLHVLHIIASEKSREIEHVFGGEPGVHICLDGGRVEAMNEQKLFGRVRLPRDGQITGRGRHEAQSREEYNCGRDGQPRARVVDVAHEICAEEESELAS